MTTGTDPPEETARRARASPTVVSEEPGIPLGSDGAGASATTSRTAPHHPERSRAGEDPSAGGPPRLTGFWNQPTHRGQILGRNRSGRPRAKQYPVTP